MLALSIRQPYAELILRGEKRIEYRSRATKIIGQRFYIYAAKGSHEPWAMSLGSGGEWDRAMLAALPRGVVVGSAVIERCQPSAFSHQPKQNGSARSGSMLEAPGSEGLFEWHLRDVKRYKRPRKPSGRPQPVWFRPFA